MRNLSHLIGRLGLGETQAQDRSAAHKSRFLPSSVLTTSCQIFLKADPFMVAGWLPGGNEDYHFII